MAVPIPVVNVALGLATALFAVTLGVEVYRRNRRLSAARLVLVGSMCLAIWAVIELLAARESDHPPLYWGLYGVARVLTMLAVCLGLHFSRIFPIGLGAERGYLALAYAPVGAVALGRVWLVSLAAGGAPGIEPTADTVYNLEVVVQLVLTVAACSNLFRQHRLAASSIGRIRVRAMGAGVVMTTLSGITAAAFTMAGFPPLGISAFHALPILATLTFAIVRYQLFDIELLKREAGILVFGALLLGLSGVAAAWLITSLAGGFQVSLALVAGVISALAFLLQHQVRAFASRSVETLFPALKWRECRVQEVLLVHHSGVLLAQHVPPSGPDHRRQGMDRTVLGEVLTVVQAVLRESLRLPEKETIRSLSIGPLKVLIEHGPSCYLAAVFEGFEHPGLRTDLRTALEGVERGYGPALEDWKGDMSRLAGIERELESVGLPVQVLAGSA